VTQPNREPWEAHVQRVDFRLTYAETEPRVFGPDHMEGPDIPDAFGPPGAQAPGEWYGGSVLDTDDPNVPARDWFAHWAHMAINEAIHEALEWFRVDGKPWLDPHGRHEATIYKYTGELCQLLAELVDPEGLHG